MVGHSLIGAYRQELLARLPADAAEEVAGGLEDAYQQYLRTGLSQEQAATAALAEFGDVGLVLDAFRRANPVWRLARALIVTGPVVGGFWAVALIASRAWDWSIPVSARLAVGPLVAVSVVLLMTALLTRHYHALRRAGIAGCLGVATLDAAVITTAMVLVPAGRWLFGVAACLSAARLTYVARAMPRVLARAGTCD
jgi:hypothetical protein